MYDYIVVRYDGRSYDSPLIEVLHASDPSPVLRQIKSPSKPKTTNLVSVIAGPAVKFVLKSFLQNTLPDTASMDETFPS